MVMQSLNSMKLDIQSLPENIALARIAVAAFASQVDMTVDELEEIKVAVSEAVSNAIIHGYENRKKEFIEIEAIHFDEYFQFTVTDYGKGIEDLEQALQPAYSTDEERMGLGFVFMQSFMDEVKVETKPGKGTKVILIKRLQPLTGPPN